MPPENVNPAPAIGASHPKYCEGVLLEEDEEVVKVVHRHFIGVVAIILVGALTLAAIAVLFFMLSPDKFNDPSFIFLGLALTTLVVLFVMIAIYIYNQSRIMITNKHLVQIMQKTLFNRKVSRLSMSNVEDVNAEVRGVFATIFNYGTLLVQTAGEMENFIFTLCPNPNVITERILEARQAYAQSIEEGNEHPPA